MNGCRFSMFLFLNTILYVVSVLFVVGVLGINVNIVDSSNKTALDVVCQQKTHKAAQIATLIAGNVSHVLMMMTCDSISVL